MVIVDVNKCIGCTKCVHDCIVNDIEMINGKAHVKNETCIKCGHCIATCPKEAVFTNEYDMSEVKPYDKETFDITPDNLLNFIKFRRSVRNFKEKDVENEKLLKIIEAGRFTQTGTNAQDVKFIVVKEKIQELRKLVLEALNNVAKVILSNEEMKAYHRYAHRFIDMYNKFLEDPNGEDRLFFKAPALIITTAKYQVNAALASSNMELMTNALGLGTFFSGFLAKAAESDPRINEFLGLEKDETLVTCMVIGYPNIKYFRTVPRKEADISWL
ncbi:MAG: nitroreductase family protein [Sarcina sp.]